MSESAYQPFTPARRPGGLGTAGCAFIDILDDPAASLPHLTL